MWSTPGGAGYLLLLDSALHVVAGEPLPEPDESAGPSAEQLEAVAHRVSGVDGELDVSEQRYEVMYLMDLDDARIDDFKIGWGAIGDSIVVVGGDGIWNCHVHTNDIGAAVEVALDLDGRPTQTDTRHRPVRGGRRGARPARGRDARRRDRRPHPSGVPSRAGAGLPPVTTAVVAVSFGGDGLAELFANLRSAGHGDRRDRRSIRPPPSCSTWSNTSMRNEVVILPNNKNIIPVAEQVDVLTDEVACRWCRPARCPQALAALIVYDPEADGEANRDEMAEAIETVRTGRDHPGGARRRTAMSVRSSEGRLDGASCEGDGIAVGGRRRADRCVDHPARTS